MSSEVEQVSVVIPVYNVAEYLEECLDSVVAQTYSHIDVILVDDGSTDGSGALCDRLAARDPRFRVIHQANHGLSHARNVGIAAATGTLVTFLDSDDWWDPTFLSALVQAMADHPAAGTAMCSLTRVPGATYDSQIDHARLLTPAEAIAQFAGRHHSLFVIACAKLFRRDLLDPDTFPVGRLAEDAFTTHRLLQSAPVVQIPDPLYFYRQRAHSITSQPMSLDRMMDEAEGSEQQVRDFTEAGLMRAAGWSADQAFRRRARLISMMESTGAPGVEEQYALLVRRTRGVPGRWRHPAFRALTAVSEASPRVAVALFDRLSSLPLRARPTSSNAPRIALTFDDGPVPGTAELAHFLVENSAPATFFLRGDRIDERPDIVRLLQSSPGLELATHSHTHPDLHRVEADGIRAELRRSNDALEAVTGTAPTLFRPPMGHRNTLVDSIAGEFGQAVVLWSVNSMDFKDPGSATAQVLAQAEDGDIVLLHDTFDQTLDTVSTLVPALRSKGFELVTVSSLLGDLSAGKVYRSANAPRVRFRRWRHLQRLRITRRVGTLVPHR